MAKKKAARKATPKKARQTAPAQQAETVDTGGLTARHQIHLHNISRKPANWTLSGGGNRVRGLTPPEGESTLHVDHTRRYKITFWVKPHKKESCNLGPDGTAIYTGRKIYVTHPH